MARASICHAEARDDVPAVTSEFGYAKKKASLEEKKVYKKILLSFLSLGWARLAFSSRSRRGTSHITGDLSILDQIRNE